MRRMLLGLAATLVALPAIPGWTARGGVNPTSLALGPSGFPSGAVITRQRVDRTATAVNNEHIFGTPDTTGNEYATLHFVATMAERALLPRFNGNEHGVFMIATVFRSAATATQAY